MRPQLVGASLVVACGFVIGCASSAHPRHGSRSQQVCERELTHSFELQYIAATLALSDHGYQRRKIESVLATQKQQVLRSPTFLSSCNQLSDREFACLRDAQDWFTYQACYQDPAVLAAWRPALEPVPGEAPPEVPSIVEPCPALAEAGAGTATVSGVVRDKKTGTPLAGVAVTVEQPGQDSTNVTITDENGRYSLDGISPGRYNVKAILDWQERQKSCEPLRGGTATVIDFAMEDEPPPPSQIIEIK